MPFPNQYDIVVAYRIYPGISKKPFIYPENKLKLTEVGIRTMRKSLVNHSAKFFFLLDNCPGEYQTMLRKYFDEKDITFLTYNGIGNLATFGKQIDVLLQQTDSDIIMFAEDDYVYRSDELGKAIRLLKNQFDVDFVTPYDHLDSYVLPIHTQSRYEIRVAQGLHWRTAASTCLTFLTKKGTLQKTESIFRSYCRKNWDSSLWFALTKFNVLRPRSFLLLFDNIFLFKTIVRSWMYGWSQILFGKKYKLWQPIPSIATHMESGSLAPTVDWEKIAKE